MFKTKRMFTSQKHCLVDNDYQMDALMWTNRLNMRKRNKVKDVFSILLMVTLTFVIITVSGFSYAAKRDHKERFYQEKTCHLMGGKIEYRLSDMTRVDCFTSKYAIEYDFANKWAEAIGQALHYARMTGKQAGIKLIMEKPSDERYYKRLKNNITYYNLPIKLWRVTPKDVE